MSASKNEHPPTSPSGQRLLVSLFAMFDIKLTATLEAEPAPNRARITCITDLRDEIFDTRLLPGDHLTQGGIAERFAVSRTPAREALQRLQSDGLMQGYVRGSWDVVPIDIKRLDDLYEMRQLSRLFGAQALRRGCLAARS